MISVVPILASLGVVQALFLALILIGRKSADRVVSLYAALVLVGLSIRIGKSVFNTYFTLEDWQQNMGIAGLLLTGPALWLCGRHLFHHASRVHRNALIHFLPAAAFLCLSWLIPNDGSLIALAAYLAILLHMLCYIAVTILTLSHHRKTIGQEQWFLHLTASMCVLWLYYLLVFFRIIPYYIGGALLYSFLIYAFSYMLLSKQGIILKKYARSGTPSPALDSIADAFDTLLQDQQPFLDASFSLEDAAGMMGTNARTLSQTVNRARGRNFSDYINLFRLQHAQKLLQAPELSRQKIASIASDAGFGNVATFNACFKRETGTTPSEFRKRYIPHPGNSA